MRLGCYPNSVRSTRSFDGDYRQMIWTSATTVPLLQLKRCESNPGNKRQPGVPIKPAVSEIPLTTLLQLISRRGGPLCATL